MKKILLGCLLFLAGTLYAAESGYFSVNDFRGGIRNDIDSTRIADNQVEDCQNVWFDEDSTAKKRKGMLKVNSIALGDAGNRYIYNQFEYKKSNGNIYHIVHASTTLYYKISGSEWTAFHLGVSSTTIMNFAVFMDTLNYCNGSTLGVNAYNADTSTFSQTTTYKPKYLISWQNRLCISGDSAEPATVRFSGFQNPKDWDTTPIISSCSASFSINSQDGQEVVGFFLSPNGNLGVLKEKSVWEIGGYDKSDFYQRLVIADIGCVDQGSVVYKEGSVYWLSTQGYIAYNGSTYSKISQNIYNTTKQIQQLNIGQGTFSKNTQNDWLTYTSTNNISITNSPGNISLKIDNSTYPIIAAEALSILKNGTTYFMALTNDVPNIMTYNLTTDIWNKYNLSTSINYYGNLKNNFIYDNNIFYYIFPYWVVYSNPQGYYTPMVSTGSISNMIPYTQSINTITENKNVQPHYMSISLNNSNVPYVVYTYIDTYLSTWTDYLYIASYTLTSNSWTNRPFYLDTYSYASGLSMVIDKTANKLHCVKNVKKSGYTSSSRIVYASCTADGTINYSSTTVVSNSVSAGYYYSVDIATYTTGTPTICYISSLNSNVYWTYNSGAGWVTPVVVTNLTGYDISKISLDILVDTNDNTYINISNAPVNNDLWIKETHLDDWRRIQRYNPNMTLSNISFGTAGRIIGTYTNSSNELGLIREATGYYISEIYDTNLATSTITSFRVTQSNDITDKYHYIRSSDTATNILNEPFTQITANSYPNTGMAQFIQYKTEISTNVIPTLFATGVNQVESAELSFKSASGNLNISSMYYDGRLWNGVSVSSGNVLDTTLILDKNNAWVKVKSSKPAMNYLNLNGTPFMASNDGYIYQLDIGNSDNGDAINSYVLTKGYDMANIVAEKALDKMYLAASRSGDWSLNLNYYLNKSLTISEFFAINLNTADLINYVIPLKLHNRFFTVQFKLYNSNANEPFDFLELYNIFRSYPLR